MVISGTSVVFTIICVLYFSSTNGDFRDNIDDLIISQIIIGMIFNIIVDWFSALETGIIIRLLSKTTKLSVQLAYVCIDLIMSSLLYIIPTFTILIATVLLSDYIVIDGLVAEWILSMTTMESLVSGDLLKGSTLGSVLFYSTFATTMWSILFFIGSMIGRYVDVMVKWLNIEEDPVNSVGMIATSIYFIVVVISMVISLLQT
jgi:hypothetical protein